MNEPTESPSMEFHQPDDQKQDDRLVDPRDLVYAGGTDRDPRELVENPAVAPEMLEDQAPEDLRDDLMPRNKDEDE